MGYFLFEVPSNLLLVRFGARMWIARIMVVWGVVASAMMFVSGPWSFYALRFLLGAAEAGFFPGIIFYLTFWFPQGLPLPGRCRCSWWPRSLSYVVGGPLSGWLMDHPQFGLKGWQWLFLVEGVPSVVLGDRRVLLPPERPAARRDG